MIAVVDYNMGNLHSVKKAFNHIGIDAIVTNRTDEIEKADKIVLPGVGHFSHGMEQLQGLNLVEFLTEQVLVKRKPILGICLGMQLLTSFSEEGNTKGLDWVWADTIKFKKRDLTERMKIPHMGWNNIKICKQSGFLEGVDEENMFYFVHSYYITNKMTEEVIGETQYGVRFTSVFQKGNIYGVQFHPEKSHDAGLVLLKNFVEIS